MNKIINGDKAKLINRLWFLAGLAVFLLFSLGLIREVVNRRQVSRQISDYQEKIAKLKVENESLSNKIQNWDTSGELEMNARSKLGLEKPGEQTIIIKRSDVDNANETVINSNQEIISLSQKSDNGEYQSNFIKWWNYFFSK